MKFFYVSPTVILFMWLFAVPPLAMFFFESRGAFYILLGSLMVVTFIWIYSRLKNLQKVKEREKSIRKKFVNPSWLKLNILFMLTLLNLILTVGFIFTAISPSEEMSGEGIRKLTVWGEILVAIVIFPLFGYCFLRNDEIRKERVNTGLKIAIAYPLVLILLAILFF